MTDLIILTQTFWIVIALVFLWQAHKENQRLREAFARAKAVAESEARAQAEAAVAEEIESEGLRKKLAIAIEALRWVQMTYRSSCVAPWDVVKDKVEAALKMLEEKQKPRLTWKL